jgi:hypothetical protein
MIASVGAGGTGQVYKARDTRPDRTRGGQDPSALLHSSGHACRTDWSPDGQVMLLRDGELMMSPGDIWAKPIDGEGYPPAGARHRLARQPRRGRQPVRGPAPNHGFLHLRGSS